MESLNGSEKCFATNNAKFVFSVCYEKESDVAFDLIKRSTGEVVKTFTLTDFLNKFDMYDVSKQEVLIPIVVRFLGVDVKVTIANWDLIEVTPGFGNDDDDKYYL